jgi:hypothetical protein
VRRRRENDIRTSKLRILDTYKQIGGESMFRKESCLDFNPEVLSLHLSEVRISHSERPPDFKLFRTTKLRQFLNLELTDLWDETEQNS